MCVSFTFNFILGLVDLPVGAFADLTDDVVLVHTTAAPFYVVALLA